MEHQKNNSDSESLNIESLRQRMPEIPLVHKPNNTSTNHPDDIHYIPVLKQTVSCCARFEFEDHCPIYPDLYERPKTACCYPQNAWPSSYVKYCSTIIEKEKCQGNDIIPRPLSIPDDCWLIGGNVGSKNSILVFRSTALASATDHLIQCKPAYKLHITYKVIQAETRLLGKLLDCHGISEVSVQCNDFNLLWTGSHPKPGIFRSLCPHQRINHFPRSYELTRKDRLYKNIERMQHLKGARNFDFIPQTFIMPGDYKELCSAHYRVKGPWIVKPVASSRGRGIFIVESPNQVPLDEPVVVAKYIDRPLLVDGHKCDLRLYVAVTSYDPLLIYIYEEGLVRFATVKYDTSHKQLWNPCMHLCNYSINKYHSDYIKSDDPCAENVGHKWTLSALLRHLKSENKDTVQLMAQIEDIVVKAILASANSIISACQMFVPNQSNCFELFGFDILIDSDLKPWLLEVNLSPSLGCDSPLDVRLKSAMLADLLTLVGIPAIDPILKPMLPASPLKSNMIKMKLGACRRVHSADGLSQSLPRKSNTVGQTGRLANSTLCLTAEETRLVRITRMQFERRGGWIRIFPTADSWCRYSQYLNPHSGIPTSALPSSTSCQLVVPHNYNFLLHTQLFPDVSQSKIPARHERYERQLTQGHRMALEQSKDLQGKSNPEEFKLQICELLKSGKSLTQGEARRTFSQYLVCILKRLTHHSSEQESHIEIVLKFLQKASTYLRQPYAVKVPSPKLAGKDRAAMVAKQLNDFLHLYNRETELYSNNSDTSNSIPGKVFTQFLETAREHDLEEVLTLQTLRSLPHRSNVNWGFQGLLKCFPNVTAQCSKAAAHRGVNKKIGIKVSRQS